MKNAQKVTFNWKLRKPSEKIGKNSIKGKSQKTKWKKLKKSH